MIHRSLISQPSSKIRSSTSPNMPWGLTVYPPLRFGSLPVYASRRGKLHETMHRGKIFTFLKVFYFKPLTSATMVWYSNYCRTAAGVVELVDTGDLKSPGSDTVPVRVRSPAPSSYRGVEQLVARRAHNPEVAGSSPVSATRQRTLKPQRFQGSFYAIWAGVFPLFFPLQIFKGNFQGV